MDMLAENTLILLLGLYFLSFTSKDIGVCPLEEVL